MSRIGKLPVALPKGVTLSVADGKAAIKGPKGELTLVIPAGVKVEGRDGQGVVECLGQDKQSHANHGTIRALLVNMVVGVTTGYTKELEIQGVGFRANIQGNKLVMALGYSHPVEYLVPEGITVAVNENTQLKVSGIDKQLVGQVAARIRSFFPPEPYKGKGVRYKGEHVRRKAGKTVA